MIYFYFGICLFLATLKYRRFFLSLFLLSHEMFLSRKNTLHELWKCQKKGKQP